MPEPPALNLPRLGLGTVAFGRDWGLKYPARIPDQSELERLLDLAHELGVTLLDTAPAYGTSEERLGRLLAKRRGRFLISTKAGEESTPAGSSYDFSPTAIRASVDRSLKRLQVPALDFVFLHSNGDDRSALEGLDALSDLRHEGKIRHIGASTKTVGGGLDAVAAGAAVMLSYSLWDRQQAPVLDAVCGAVPVLIKKPLDSGRHLDGRGPAEALRFAAGHPAVSSVLLGTTNPDHLAQAARALAM